MKAEQVARGLGVFSIGLGLAELIAPKRLGGYLGMGHRAGLLRLYGLREIGAGAGILARPSPAAGVWARVGGDALDLAALGAELANGNPRKGRVAVATGAIAALTALDAATAQRLAAANSRSVASQPADNAVKRSVTVGKPADELDRLWRDPHTLPRVMGDAADVTVKDEQHAHWKVDGPLGRTLEWDSEVVEDRPGELVRWRSLPGASLPNQGSLAFRAAPRDLGTEVTLEFRFDPPEGILGAAIAALPNAVPDMAVGTALRRFKSLAETGRVMTAAPRPGA